MDNENHNRKVSNKAKDKVQNYKEIMKVISMVNVDEEISNMLDAFYVNDQPEYKFIGETIIKDKKQSTTFAASTENSNSKIADLA